MTRHYPKPKPSKTAQDAYRRLLEGAKPQGKDKREERKP